MIDTDLSLWNCATTLRRRLSIALCGLLAFAAPSRAADPIAITIDVAQPLGPVRALHGINKGPLAPGGLIDLTDQMRELGVPSIRLHDCHWPNPDVVDIHAVFPNFAADPARPESYDFRRTDDYLAAARATGAEIVFRLGESIEHEKVKRFVHPPADVGKWAEICAGIIRHYNEGWANGFRFGIRYWEIWNEPENRPAMWTGTDDGYFALYRTTAKLLKARWPELKIGGPSVGALGEWKNGELHPSAFVLRFLDFCRRESLPLDFFSWHCYTDRTEELTGRAKAVRALLDQHGFTATESHLNEWNHLPDRDWKGITRGATAAERARFARRMAGAEGAAFITAALIELQDAPIDVCNLFHGELGAFGLFDEHGVPQKNFHALRAFRAVSQMKQRLRSNGVRAGQTAVLAAKDDARRSVLVLLSNPSAESQRIQIAIDGLPWKPAKITTQFLDSDRDLLPDRDATQMSVDSLAVDLPAPGVALVTITAP